MPLALLSAMLLQVGPMVSPGAAPAIAQPPLRDSKTRRRRQVEAEPVTTPAVGRLTQCLRLIDSDSAASRADVSASFARDGSKAESVAALISTSSTICGA